MASEEVTADFNKKIGEILSSALNTEFNLDFFIASYFVKPKRNEKDCFRLSSEKMGFFTDVVLNELDFETKIKVFTKIWVHKRFDTKKLKNILKAIRFIQKTRNRVAHWERRSKEKEIYFVERNYFGEDKIKLELTDEFMNKVEKARIEIVSDITSISF